MSWYDTIVKPAWAPAASVYGTVWSVLYPIIFIAYGYVACKALVAISPASCSPIGINLAANFAFTPLEFGLQNLPLATIDIVIVLVTIVWSMIAIWPHACWPRSRCCRTSSGSP